MKRVFLVLLLSLGASAAFGAFTEFYCDASTGANINAGDKTANGVVTSTNGGWSTVTNVFTAASGTPFSGVTAGDFASVYTDGATVAVYIGRVTTVGGGGATLTISSTAKSGTAPTTAASGISCTTGGAWKGPNSAVGFPFATITGTATNSSSDQVRVNFKSGTNYAITAQATASGAGPITYQGYTTTAGDGGKATIDGGTTGASYILVSTTGNQTLLRDFICQNNGATGSAEGIKFNAVDQIERIVVHDVRGHGVNNAAGNFSAIECETYNCNASNQTNSGGFSDTGGGNYVRCISHDQTGSNNSGFVSSSVVSSYTECIADTCTLRGFNFQGIPSGMVLTRCVGYNCGVGLGNSTNTLHQTIADSCLWISNTTYGVNISATGFAQVRLLNNGYFGNGTAQTTVGAGAALVETGAITLASSPFVDAANGDFRINLATAKGAGRGTFTQTATSYTGTIGYPDIGAAQHLETAGGVSRGRMIP